MRAPVPRWPLFGSAIQWALENGADAVAIVDRDGAVTEHDGPAATRALVGVTVAACATRSRSR